jgi:hypothetical protein
VLAVGSAQAEHGAASEAAAGEPEGLRWEASGGQVVEALGGHGANDLAMLILLTNSMHCFSTFRDSFSCRSTSAPLASNSSPTQRGFDE